MVKHRKNEFKIIVIGNISVGKTSLIKQFVKSEFKGDYKPTLGTDIYLKLLKINSEQLELQIWDIAGSKNFGQIRQNFYKKSNAVCLVFDLTRKNTFSDLNNWINEFNKAEQKDALFYLIGNKSDLELNDVNEDQIISFCKKNSIIRFKEASAKTGANVDQAFYDIAKELLKLKS